MSARRRAAALAVAGALAVVGAGCGDSPEDTAHSDGKAVGRALAQLGDARNPQELTSGVLAVRDAVGGVSDDVGGRVREQVAAQRDGLDAVVGTLRTAITSGDPAQQASARVQLQSEIQDLRARAESFGKTGDSVTNSFWDGVKDGFDDD